MTPTSSDPSHRPGGGATGLAVDAVLRSDATALEAVRALLAPEGGGGPVRRYAVLPRPDRPRYVVPVGRHHAGAAHIRPGAGRAQAATRAVLRPVLGLGAGRLLPGGLAVADGTDADPSLRRHLATALRRPDLDLAVALGGPRPNRKPVLQLIDGDGTTVAWAKVAVDALTDRLVAHETEALAAHRSAPPLVTPEVLASGTWRGHRYLVLAHLELAETAGDLDLTAEAVRAVAGPTADEDVATSRWWLALVDRAGRGDEHGRALAALLGHLGPRLAGRRWPFGAWHGDLAPWNASWRGDRLVLWDWERSTSPVPLGIDLAHDRIQVAMLRDGRSLADGVDDVVRRDGATLAALGYDRDDRVLVVAAYLATLRARYADDAALGSLGPGARIAAAIDDDPTLGGRLP